jgi:hypothetical protein
MGILTDDMKRIVREQRSGSDRRAGQRQDAFLLAEAVGWSRRMMPEELLRCQGIPFSPPVGWVIIIPVINTLRNVNVRQRISGLVRSPRKFALSHREDIIPACDNLCGM